MKLIYETRGRAQEYCKLALNHYAGCGHGCIYCYAPDVVHKNRGEFHSGVRVRCTADDIKKDAIKAKAAGMSGDVLLSFTTDPYQPIDKDTRLTRQAIILLQETGFKVVVLTKAGDLARRDFDILRPGIDTFATTLTCFTTEYSKKWEPHAGLPAVRLNCLYDAKSRGIKTWVSCEPVIYPQETIRLIGIAADFTDHFKIGTMNYHPHGKTIDWKSFAERIVDLQPKVGRPFYLKKDLARYLGKSEGVWIGACQQ